jgi:hypothetical protein
MNIHVELYQLPTYIYTIQLSVFFYDFYISYK